jgi:hypothetical protein
MSYHNESAISFNWLKQTIEPGGEQPGIVVQSWNNTRDRMRNMKQGYASSQHWVSDYWICKGIQFSGQFMAKWTPPDHIDEFPSPGLQIPHAHRTNHSYFSDILTQAPAPEGFDVNEAVNKFFALDDATIERADSPMHQAQYVRAWLFTALGPLLMSITLSPRYDQDVITSETKRRLSIHQRFKKGLFGIHFSEAELEILYNCRQSAQGNLSLSDTQVGQGDEWMKHWQWLSKTIDPHDALNAVRLTAQLMRNDTLIRALISLLQEEDVTMQELILAVLRRWLLSLKAMVWLENALTSDWKSARTEDLACFAYSAVKPEWPRRLISVSHRSFEVKPLLQQSKAWNSALFAIDAMYVPAWETNTGMIWGLFANTPVMTIVLSKEYTRSSWCLRESELLMHLQKDCDFRADRYLWVLRPEEVAAFDDIHNDWYSTNALNYIPGLESLTGFPPLCNVYVPQPHQPWELAMLRAAGAMRIFHATYLDPAMVNQLGGLLLLPDMQLPLPDITNQPGGWEEYKKVFQDLAMLFPGEPVTHLSIYPQAPIMNEDETQKFFDRIPDLMHGTVALADVLVAFEWMESLLPILYEASLGDMIMIDLRGLTKEQWKTDPAYSLQRGIAALRQPPKPVWFIQYAGQEVDQWELPGEDRPIFTQHLENQFSWMWEGSFSPDWPSVYATRCGLQMSPQLMEKCMATSVPRQPG